MAERRLRCALVRKCDMHTANTEVQICLYILLKDICEMTCRNDLLLPVNYQAASALTVLQRFIF